MDESKVQHYDVMYSIKRTQIYIVTIIICVICFDANWMVFGSKAPFQHAPNSDRRELRQLSQNYSDICKARDVCDQKISNLCCGYCSCHPRCAETGTCCPSELESFWETIQPTQECIPLSYKAPEYVRRQFMIASCPASFRGPEVVEKCEKRHSAPDLLSFLPIDDRSKGDTYSNRYCAECQNVTSENFLYWNAQVQCNYTALTPRNYDTLLSNINETADCDLVLRPVKTDPTKSCYSLVSSCNATGLWEEYDRFTAQACQLFLAPYMEKYRNPFCAICNGMATDNETSCGNQGGNLLPSRDIVPFTALLQFRPEFETIVPNEPETKCKPDEIYDPIKDMCRDLECDFGKILTNTSCNPAFKSSSGVCYKAMVQFTVLRNRTDVRNANETIPDDAEALVLVFEKEIISFLEKHRIQQYVKNISFYKPGNSKIGDIILADFLINAQTQIDMEELTLQMNKTFNGKTLVYAISANKSDSVRVDLIRLRSSTAKGIVSPWTLEAVLPFRVRPINPYMQAKCVGQAVIITAFSFHPFIRIDRAFYNWTKGPFGVKIYDLDIFVENALFREGEDESMLFVSVTVLIDVFNEFVDRSRSAIIIGGVSTEIQGILSLILVGTSILCLLLTLIVYALLPALRSQPGINNMILSVLLLIAYVIFLSLSSQPESDLVCELLGGATHFAWLLVLMWMNICSFHMFRVFGTMNKQHSSTGIKTTTCMYILYCVMCSTAFVAINVGVTYYTSNGGSYGYGSAKTGFCYIYDPELTLFVITIPCIVIVTANIVMFFIVIYRLKCMTDVKRHVQNDRNYFLIHIRLSTITGMTWIVALPMVLTNLVVFTYVYIILVCSQGIYLMMAFVCNKRVFNLLVNKMTAKTVSRRATYETNITDAMSGSQNSKIATSYSRETVKDLSVDEIKKS